MILYWIWLLLEMQQVLRLWQLQKLLELQTAQTICKQALAFTGLRCWGSKSHYIVDDYASTPSI